jgi:hypothetical protein
MAVAGLALVLAAPQSGATVMSGGVPQLGMDASLVEQVRRDGGRGIRGGGYYRGTHFAYRGHPRRHWRGGGWSGVPFIYGGYYGYYGDCSWLRRRAFLTGSHYWWRRYRDCRGW